jgi:hypothetical protein
MVLSSMIFALNIRCHDVIRTLGDHMDDITLHFSPVDGTVLRLAADSIALQDESAAVLVGVLSKTKSHLPF